jgi:hypothetical protein
MSYKGLVTGDPEITDSVLETLVHRGFAESFRTADDFPGETPSSGLLESTSEQQPPVR